MRRIAIFKSVFAVLAAGILLCPAGMQAQTTYTSLQEWQAAVADSWQFATSFQSLTHDTYFQAAPVNFGPFSLQQSGQDPTFGHFQNFVDVPPLQFTDNSGVRNAAIYTKFGITAVNLTFSEPVYAWGANFYGAQTSELENIVLTAAGGGAIATVPVTVNTGFFGFVANEAVSQIEFTSQIDNPTPSVGQGFGLENVVGAYLSGPTLVKPTQILVTASGLSHSRVTQTFNGTVTISNVGKSSVSGPFQITFPSLPSGVTLANAQGSYNGNPFISVPVAGLAPGQSGTVSVQFSNPSNSTIKSSPQVYAGGFN